MNSLNQKGKVMVDDHQKFILRLKKIGHTKKTLILIKEIWQTSIFKEIWRGEKGSDLTLWILFPAGFVLISIAVAIDKHASQFLENLFQVELKNIILFGDESELVLSTVFFIWFPFMTVALCRSLVGYGWHEKILHKFCALSCLVVTAFTIYVLGTTMLEKHILPLISKLSLIIF